MNKQDREEIADEKLKELQQYFNQMEEEITLNQDANLAKIGIIFGKMQGVYKEVAFFRNLFKDVEE